MMRIPRSEAALSHCHRILAPFLIVVAQLSCGKETPVTPPVPPTHGSLAVTVSGMPSYVSPLILVTGPSGPFDVITRDTVLRSLEPGLYTITPTTTMDTSGRYVPDTPLFILDVNAGVAREVTVTYALWNSKLTVTVSGLPENQPADIEICGTALCERSTQHTTTFVGLKSGEYNVVAREVVVDGTRYGVRPISRTVTLPAGPSHVAVAVAYVPLSAQLTIAAGVLPRGLTPGSAFAQLTGPDGFRRGISANGTVGDLEPGVYTLTATPITLDGITYVPSPASQQLTLTSGSVITATLIFRGELGLQRVIPGSLPGAVYLTAPSGDSRLFVVQRGGQVRVIKDGSLLATPFLDLSARVSTDGERGLLSIAFDPLYSTNGFVYAYFTDLTGDIVIERFSSTPGADVASPAPTSILTVPHREFNNHNGGLIMFGPDGRLFAATGDGGGGGDPLGNGQNPNSRLGKMLRIDVRATPATVEIWAMGLRNPWRFDFRIFADQQQATLYIADVGQSRYEEINIVSAQTSGVNYGWNLREGRHCYPSGELCIGSTGLFDPQYQYSHTEGCSITGGFAYRGAIDALRDGFTFSDFCRGWLRTLVAQGGWTAQEWTIPSIGQVVSFGEDAAGEQYMINAPGEIWKIARK